VSEPDAELETARELLRSRGYLVFRVPACTREGGHGKHVLLTGSAMCPGVAPVPHGFLSSYETAFGTRVNCLCGDSFLDDAFSDEDERDDTAWQRHLNETT
jgi:hypothetical protein